MPMHYERLNEEEGAEEENNFSVYISSANNAVIHLESQEEYEAVLIWLKKYREKGLVTAQAGANTDAITHQALDINVQQKTFPSPSQESVNDGSIQSLPTVQPLEIEVAISPDTPSSLFFSRLRKTLWDNYFGKMKGEGDPPPKFSREEILWSFIGSFISIAVFAFIHFQASIHSYYHSLILHTYLPSASYPFPPTTPSPPVRGEDWSRVLDRLVRCSQQPSLRCSQGPILPTTQQHPRFSHLRLHWCAVFLCDRVFERVGLWAYVWCVPSQILGLM